MASEFDHEAETPADAVLSVADEIRSVNRLAPLTDDQKIWRQVEHGIWAREQALLSEQRRADRERQQAEAEAVARAEHAAELAEANRKARLERQAQIERAANQRELADLRFQSARQQAWQSNVERAARNAVAIRQRETLMGELENMLTPPAPPPEPTVVYIEAAEGSDQLGTSDFNPKLWMQKSRSWF